MQNTTHCPIIFHKREITINLKIPSGKFIFRVKPTKNPSRTKAVNTSYHAPTALRNLSDYAYSIANVLPF